MAGKSPIGKISQLNGPNTSFLASMARAAETTQSIHMIPDINIRVKAKRGKAEEANNYRVLRVQLK